MADVPNIRQIVNAIQTGFMDASLVLLGEALSHRPALSDMYQFALIFPPGTPYERLLHRGVVCGGGGPISGSDRARDFGRDFSPARKGRLKSIS
ncbi:hypothetical protein BN77_3192 [Rhizobium mesoamericanum STM3625]|uniref:Uncharacterized protein n=1 Tax=Rhizobium mesoamericanum STM3625 TaxID=1211777 RepID=K0PWL5_9HYPH|nr:hypothetical protein BN77_3192 [Rhizobium mesoamericanum STM3625]